MDSAPEEIEQQAAAWVLRCDRGLTPAEQDDFCQWLAADPRHRAEIVRHRKHWSRLDTLVHWRPEFSVHPNPDLLAPPRRSRLQRFLPISLAVAAGVAIAATILGWHSMASNRGASRTLATSAPFSANGQRILDDGSIIELNQGAEVTVRYTTVQRQVRLERGEAHFTVTKDPARPFVVTAQGVDIRAVGTAFNVRMERVAVEVLVTEGRVEIDGARDKSEPTESHDGRPAKPPLIPRLEARQRAVVSTAPHAAPPQIATLTSGEIERVLAWQHRMLDFTAKPLRDVVLQFNRYNTVQLVVLDEELASVPISATIRSDNLDAFVRLVEAGFVARAERRGESEIVLRKFSAAQKRE
jgi:transmembrane sensor